MTTTMKDNVPVLFTEMRRECERSRRPVMYWQEAATVGDEPQPPPDEDNDYMLMGQDNEDDKDARTLGMLIESRARGSA